MIKYLILLHFIVVFSLRGQDFSGIDRFINETIDTKQSPNVNLVIGNNSKNIYQKAYGNFTYDSDSEPVNINAIYDLASLTKVFSTTLCIMKLVEEHEINLSDKVSKYLPGFGAKNKDNITITNLLLHNSGLPAYYSPKKDEKPDEIINSIYNLDKAYVTGQKYLYSCLNFVTLMKVVEAVTNKRMYDYYKEIIVKPLNLQSTYFIPDDSLIYRIVPTTPVLRGKVHDPLAYGLNGLSGNAGLFSTTSDLSIICQMLLNKGIYKGVKIFEESTVKQFTSQYDSSSSRGLGWDTNDFLNSSAGTYFSKETYGHTGYTGTSVWIDPINNIFVVLLTNRVYPDDKVSLTEMRIKLHNYIFMTLNKIPPQPQIECLNIKNDSVVVNLNNQGNFVKTDSTYLVFSNGNFNSTPIYIGHSNCFSFSVNNLDLRKPINCKLFNKTGKNVSLFSDEFSVLNKNPEVLIIDGCTLESSNEKKYNTLTKEYFSIIPQNFGYLCAEISFAQKMNNLSEYKAIIIYTAESSSLSTFNDSLFIESLINYAKSGGNLLISGSDIGWYMGRAEAGDYLNKLYKQLFNCTYKFDNSHSVTLFDKNGRLKTEGIFNFGTDNAIYKTRTPDVIIPLENSKPLFWYDDKNIAGNVTELGKGKIIYLAFPFESIENLKIKEKIISDILLN